MSYTHADFQSLIVALERSLLPPAGEAKPCLLYNCGMLKSYEAVRLATGEEIDHVADACNLDGSFQSIERLLSLPQTDDDCGLLSRILVRELGCLWESVDHAIKAQRALEENVGVAGKLAHRDNKGAGRCIKLWADALKHPNATIVAHQCVETFEEADTLIDSQKLEELFAEMKALNKTYPADQKSTGRAWNEVWQQYSGSVIVLALPSVTEIIAFLDELDSHLDYLIGRRKRLARHLKNPPRRLAAPPPFE